MKQSTRATSGNSPGLIGRRSHTKSRLGCSQCRARHIKCDERKPLCLNCSKHFVNLPQCDFPKLTSRAHRAPRRIACREEFTSTIDYSHATNRSHLESYDTKSRSAENRFLRSPGESQFDPFYTHPPSAVPTAQNLMQHFISRFKTRSFPIELGYSARPLIQRWWPSILEDSVLFHAALSLSCMDIHSVQTQTEDYNSVMLLRRECIRLMRMRVEDAMLDTSDETICAVLFLAIVEHENDNKQMVRMHVEGLKRMVAVRGGLAALNQSTANIIFGTTMTIMSEPQFPPDIELLLAQMALSSPTPLAPCDLTQAELQIAGVAPSFAELFMDIKYMVEEFCTVWPQRPHPTYCSNLLQRMLYLPPLEDHSSLGYAASESCRFSVSLISFWPFQQEYPNPKLRTNVGIHKLKAALEVMIPFTNKDQRFLTWLLFIGGAFSEGPERRWFISELVTLSTMSGISTWEDMKEILCRYIWADQFCEPPTKVLWDEVTTLKSRLNIM